MAKNFIQPGEVVPVIAAGTIASGSPVLIGALFGVAQTDAAAGESVEIARRGVFSLPKVSAQAWTQGAKLYWDATDGVATSTAGTNALIGVAAAAAPNPSATGLVLLDGTIR